MGGGVGGAAGVGRYGAEHATWRIGVGGVVGGGVGGGGGCGAVWAGAGRGRGQLGMHWSP